MANPLFEFFEVIADELSAEASRVITQFDLEVRDQESPLLEGLKYEMDTNSTEEAIQLAVDALRIHFEAKGGRLPFDYEAKTGRFTAHDRDFLSFIKDMSSIRSLSRRSRDFECGVAQRLGERATGSVHRVGYPRDRLTKSKDFNAHLRTLGFARPVLLGREKDGGLDILWLLPIGALAHRPIVSVQCKNGAFDIEAADASIGAGLRSFSQHAGLIPSVHVPCVLFNDYIDSKDLTTKQMNFVPLGLTDLTPMIQRTSVECI